MLASMVHTMPQNYGQWHGRRASSVRPAKAVYLLVGKSFVVHVYHMKDGDGLGKWPDDESCQWAMCRIPQVCDQNNQR